MIRPSLIININKNSRLTPSLYSLMVFARGTEVTYESNYYGDTRESNVAIPTSERIPSLWNKKGDSIFNFNSELVFSFLLILLEK